MIGFLIDIALIILLVKCPLLLSTPLKNSYPEAPLNFSSIHPKMRLIKGNKGQRWIGSGKLGADGIDNLQNYLTSNGFSKIKTILYVHSDGFNQNSIYHNFARNEHLYCNQNGMLFLSCFDNGLYYLNGRNPSIAENKLLSKEQLNELIDPLTQKEFNLKSNFSLDLSGQTQSFIEILKTILNPQYAPLLFHCRHGVHRTGMLVMALRYLEGGEWLISKPSYQGEFYYKDSSGKRVTQVLKHLSKLELEYYHFAKPKARVDNIEFIRMIIHSPKYEKTRLILKDLYNRYTLNNTSSSITRIHSTF